ncbi:hypothetical protein BGX31_001984 [Mortierella sp. GBA43]|nr:hypothetical protein BGX31_001984 [Mortierella sp. GBA43]
MEELDKEQTRSLQSTSRTSSMAMALAIPEIITNIFSFLDRPSLPACLQVSRLWHDGGQPKSWQTRSVTTLQLRTPLDDRMQAFRRNSHRIQSLAITEPRDLLEDFSGLPDALPEDQSSIEFPNLKHLILKTDPTRARIFRDNGIPNHMENILRQCSWIQDLEWDASDLGMTTVLVKSVLRHTTNNLRRLSISGVFEVHELGIFEYLIEAHSAYRQHQRGRLEDMSIANPIETTSHLTSGGHGGGCGQLDELILRNHALDINPYLDPTALRNNQGILPIRSLTLVGFKTEVSYNQSVSQDLMVDDEEEGSFPGYFLSHFNTAVQLVHREDDAVLAIAEKCPHLEKLHVTFNISSITADISHLSFQHALTHRFKVSPTTKSTRADFVQILVSSCPNLRDIELGMMRHLSPQHWNELTRAYGQQLESFSVWGNHGRFDISAFMTLIGPPLTHPSRHRPHCLTRLNINGLDYLQDCAWVALQHLPHLKEFRARDVALDARQLVMKDGWMCKGLEVLEICIAIYKKRQTKMAWHWCDSEGKWATDGPCSCSEEIRSAKEEPTLEDVVGSIRSEDQANDGDADLGLPGNESGATTEMKGGADQYLKELQIKTGLDRLAPLKNLEKLVVTRLDDKLAGKKEVEWIAHNWIHYRNRRWLQKHSPAPEESTGPEDIFLGAKFRELIGISAGVSRAINANMQNIDWLKEQCPTLRH